MSQSNATVTELTSLINFGPWLKFAMGWVIITFIILILRRFGVFDRPNEEDHVDDSNDSEETEEEVEEKQIKRKEKVY